MEVLEAAVHRLVKMSQSTTCEARPASAPLVSSDRLRDLVRSLVDTYNKRTSQRTGTFDADTEHYPFSDRLRAYLDDSESFFELTKWALNHLRHEMEKVFFATGGYIFFAKYRVSAGEFFVVAKLTDADGQAFSEDLTEVRPARHISTDRLQQVGRVNLNGWRQSSGKYLTFVSAREGSQSADYFTRFLGCAAATNARSETQKLVHVISDYCKHRSMDEQKTTQFKQVAHDTLVARQKASLSLSGLANAVEPSDPEAFISFVNEHPDAPSDEAMLDGRSLKALISYTIKMDGATLNMTRQFKIKHEVKVTDGGDLLIRNIDAEAVRRQLE